MCGACKGRYGIVNKERYGCRNHFNRRTCDNNRTIQRAEIEERALKGLTENLVSAEAVAEAARAYHQEMNRRYQERRAQASADRDALARIEHAVAKMIKAIEDGFYESSMKARLALLQQERAEVTVRLAETEPQPLDVNPNIAEIYRRKVMRLHEALSDPQARQEAQAAIRSLIGEIVLMPGSSRGEVHTTLSGELGPILAFAAGRNTRGTSASGRTLSVVAGAGSHRCYNARNVGSFLAAPGGEIEDAHQLAA